MLNLEGFLHRYALAEIISRWMVDRPRPGDVRELKEVVNLNAYLARVWVDRLARELLERFHGQVPRAVVSTNKGAIKDFSVEHPTYTNARIEALRAQYRRFPEDYYRETPLHGNFYVIQGPDGPQLVGTTRIKRFRRVAEKGSRRIVDYMLARIRASADLLAEERALAQGVPKSKLVTPPATMVEEFLHAERRVIKSIKKGTIHAELPVLPIPDVVGIKLIVENQDYPRFLRVLETTEGVRILEEERHTGRYEATNLRIAWRLPKQALLRRPPSGAFLRVLEYRGFEEREIPSLFEDFVLHGDDEVAVEIIVTDFAEYMESEIGRCMHEDRILSQRAHPDYNGHLATNVRHLMSYILNLCRGPGMEDLDEVPIKLWVKYMPDYVEDVMRRIHLPEAVFMDRFPEPSEELPPAAPRPRTSPSLALQRVPRPGGGGKATGS